MSAVTSGAMSGSELDIPRFERPYDTEQIDRTVLSHGVAILERAISEDLRTRLCDEIDQWLEGRSAAAKAKQEPTLGVSRDSHTVRLHSLASKIPCAPEVIAHPDILGWARRMLSPLCAQVLLSAAEYLERGPGEEAAQGIQGLHRGTDLWPQIPLGVHPVNVHAVLALAPFTPEDGAQWFAMESHRLPRDRQPDPGTLVQAIMDPGDAVIFRSDLIHSGGQQAARRARLRAVSIGYQVGWLRPVDNGTLSVPPPMAARFSEEVQELLGYGMEAGLGGYEGKDPKRAIDPYCE